MDDVAGVRVWRRPSAGEPALAIAQAALAEAPPAAAPDAPGAAWVPPAPPGVPTNVVPVPVAVPAVPVPDLPDLAPEADDLPPLPPPDPALERWWEIGLKPKAASGEPPSPFVELPPPTPGATPWDQAAPDDAAPGRHGGLDAVDQVDPDASIALGASDTSPVALPRTVAAPLLVVRSPYAPVARAPEAAMAAGPDVPARPGRAAAADLGSTRHAARRDGADRRLGDVTRRGTASGRVAGLGLLVTGLVGLAVTQRMALLGQLPAMGPAWAASGAVAVTGSLLLATSNLVPWRPRILIARAGLDDAAWVGVRREWRSITRRVRVGAVGIALGAGILAAAYHVHLTEASRIQALAAAGAVAAIGAVVAGVATAQRRLLRRLHATRGAADPTAPAAGATPRAPEVTAAAPTAAAVAPVAAQTAGGAGADDDVEAFLDLPEADEFLELDESA